MLAIFVMIALNRIVENLTYNVGYIFHLYIRNQKSGELPKVITLMLTIILFNDFIMQRCFHSGKLTFNVGYFFHILLMCMCQLKFCEKQDELTFNVGY